MSAARGKIDRRPARVLAMQVLCQLDAQGDGFLDQVPGFLADETTEPMVVHYAQRLIESAWKDRELTAAEFSRHVPTWSVERLTPVDRNIIRTALAEFDLGEAPPRAIINEAVEIGREYGTAESAAFINGVLDGIWKEQRPQG